MAASRTSQSRGARPRRAARRSRTGFDPRQVAGHPWIANIGAAGAGVAGVALASAFGAGELMAGGILAYIAYRVLRHGVSPTQAVREGVEAGQGAPGGAAA